MLKKSIKILTMLLIVASLFTALSMTTSAEEVKEINYYELCPTEYVEIFDEMQDKYNVSSSLLMALCFCESSYNPKAVSEKGAKGLMQIMSCNNPERLNLYDPHTNIELGTQVLLKYKELSEGDDLYLALSYYYGLGDTAYRWYTNEQWSKFTYAQKVLDIAMQIEKERGY